MITLNRECHSDRGTGYSVEAMLIWGSCATEINLTKLKARRPTKIIDIILNRFRNQASEISIFIKGINTTRHAFGSLRN